nr:MAG TPA: Sec1-binding region of Mso1 [Caudoviricetes sp.]
MRLLCVRPVGGNRAYKMGKMPFGSFPKWLSLLYIVFSELYK